MHNTGVSVPDQRFSCSYIINSDIHRHHNMLTMVKRPSVTILSLPPIPLQSRSPLRYSESTGTTEMLALQKKLSAMSLKRGVANNIHIHWGPFLSRLKYFRYLARQELWESTWLTRLERIDASSGHSRAYHFLQRHDQRMFKVCLQFHVSMDNKTSTR